MEIINQKKWKISLFKLVKMISIKKWKLIIIQIEKYVTRQYFCLKCGKGYSRKSGVNQHMKTAHETEKPDILDDVKCDDGDEEINTKIHIIIQL